MVKGLAPGSRPPEPASCTRMHGTCAHCGAPFCALLPPSRKAEVVLCERCYTALERWLAHAKPDDWRRRPG